LGRNLQRIPRGKRPPARAVPALGVVGVGDRQVVRRWR